jgi:DNA helicase HerA-like ATPase
MVTNNILHWLSGGTRSREISETRAAWEQTERYWQASPLSRRVDYQRAIDFMSEVIEDLPRLPAQPLTLPLYEAAADVFELEDGDACTPNWEAVEADAFMAVEFRQFMSRRRRYATEYDRIHGILTRQLRRSLVAYVEALPDTCFGEWPEAGSAFEVPLVDLLEEPAKLIHTMFVAAFADDAVDLDLFLHLRKRLERNLVVASGLPPTADPIEFEHKLVWPADQRQKTPGELVDLYLKGTPFARLFNVPVPLSIPDEIRFEHAHIIGGTGHGKTQLLQRMIFSDLEAAVDDRRSVVVIDSQGDLINKLLRLEIFDGERTGNLADRLVLVDPSDIEHPVCLNLFDAHLGRLEGYRPVDRERVLNGVVELYENFFGDLLGAELTQKQEVVFRYLARLMLSIPGATIHTLMAIMQSPEPPWLRSAIGKLDGSARFFFETEFFHPSFAATKKQILRRLWGVLSTPTFERMFAHPSNKIDLFEATNQGKIVLINTAKDLLKRDGSALLGRFFMNMLAQAALERSVLPEHERTPTFVYVDEAQEYFDDSIETILEQARKYRIGLVAAHQSLDQPSPRIRSALLSNTSFKCAGGVSAKDAHAVAGELRTTPEFIESMRRRGGRTEFAAWVKHWTPHAVRLSVPLGYLERQPVLSEEALDALVASNRERYCTSYDEVLAIIERTRPNASAEAPQSRPTAETPLPAPAATREKESPPAAPATAPPSDFEEWSAPIPEQPVERQPRELGKGGKKHRYLQALVKELAEAQGFRATIEAPYGGGQMDVLLEREKIRVAVEVSVTTPVQWERENLHKVLAGDFARVALVLAKSQTTAGRYREAVVDGLSQAQLARLSILYPEDLPDFIAGLAPAPDESERLVRGYRVKVSRSEVSAEEAKARRGALARLVSQSLSRPMRK